MDLLMTIFLAFLLVVCIAGGYLLICSGIVLVVVRKDREKSGKKVGKVLNFFSFVNIPLGLVLMTAGIIIMTT